MISPLPIEVTNLEISNLEVGSLQMEEVSAELSHAQVPWSKDQVWADTSTTEFLYIIYYLIYTTYYIHNVIVQSAHQVS